MPNFFPYLLLVVAAVSIMIYLLVRTKNGYAIVLSLSLSGLIFLFEYVILILLDSYQYMPKVLANPFLDSIMGAIVSNLFIVPVLAAAFVILRLRKMWAVAIALFLTGIEWLFLRLDIFEHHWWRLPYTTASVLILLGTAWLLDRKIAQGNRSFRFIFLFTFSFWWIDTSTFVLLLSGIRHYAAGVFEEPAKDDILLHVPYSFLKTLLIFSVIWFTRKIYWLIGALLVIFTSTFLLIRMEVLKLFIPEWLYFIIYAICCLLAVFVIYRTERWFRRRFNP